jgi:hypothetical protein
MAANQNLRIIPLEDGWNDVKQVRQEEQDDDEIMNPTLNASTGTPVL